MSSGCFLLSLTSSSLSFRLSRPLQTAVEFLLSQGGPVLACTDIISRLTLEDRKYNTFSLQTITSQRLLEKNSPRGKQPSLWVICDPSLTGPWFLEQSQSGRRWASRYPWNLWSHTRKRSDECVGWISFFPKANLPNSQKTPHQASSPRKKKRAY